jgi:hypothetical protein
MRSPNFINLRIGTFVLTAGVSVATSSAVGLDLAYDFDDLTVGRFDADELDPTPWLAHREVNGYVASWGGDKHLKVNYDANAAGVGNGSGLRFFTALKPRDEYFVSYRVRFEPGFAWVQGGKLPGLAGGDAAAGGVAADGDGWTARKMWKEAGELVPYVYHMHQPGRFGHIMDGTDAFFTPGRWYQITSRVKLNTGDRRDGIYQLWLDGVLVEDARDLQYRDNDRAPIDAFHFETFFGGSGPDASPTTDQTVRFDDVRVATTFNLAHFGEEWATRKAVPEPTSAGLVLATAAVVLRRRRRAVER